MKTLILPQAAKAVEKEPFELKQSVFGVLERLSDGEEIGMPLCRSLSTIMRGLYELRFSYQAGEYRVFYYIKVGEAIYVVHAMKKKSRKIDTKTIMLLKNRIRSLP
ncbi:MAG: type II toxin-antitoxin system RelE/ParE family toxin [Deltaproteobacteria bacterium]|nr:type II toxin-antitoxin system RelE/ParE family toxin [Deltaproteobacteria bacterium]